MDFRPVSVGGLPQSRIPLATRIRKRLPTQKSTQNSLGKSLKSVGKGLQTRKFDGSYTQRSPRRGSDEFSTISDALAKNLPLKVHQRKEEEHRRLVLAADSYFLKSQPKSFTGLPTSPPSRSGSVMSRMFTPTIEITRSSDTPDTNRTPSVLSNRDLLTPTSRAVTPEVRKSVLSYVNWKSKFNFLPRNATPAGRAQHLGTSKPAPPHTRTGHSIGMSDYTRSLDTRNIRAVSEEANDDKEMNNSMDWSPQAATSSKTPRGQPLPSKTYTPTNQQVGYGNFEHSSEQISPERPPPHSSTVHGKQVVYTKPKKHVRARRNISEPIAEDEVTDNYGLKYHTLFVRQKKKRNEILTDSLGNEYLLQKLDPHRKTLLGTDSIYHIEDYMDQRLLTERERDEDQVYPERVVRSKFLPYSIPYVPSGKTLKSESILVPADEEHMIIDDDFRPKKKYVYDPRYERRLQQQIRSNSLSDLLHATDKYEPFHNQRNENYRFKRRNVKYVPKREFVIL